MNYKLRKKERTIRKRLINILNLFKTKRIILDFSGKITLIGIFLMIFAIFLPWLYTGDNNKAWNAFSNIGGNIGYIIILPIIFILFIILSSNTKEKLKLASNINIKNYIIIIFFSIHCIITSIFYISFINGLNIFSNNIEFGKGIILFLLAGIVILIGGLIKRKNYYKNDYYSYINENNQTKNNIDNESNMKLPF